MFYLPPTSNMVNASWESTQPYVAPLPPVHATWGYVIECVYVPPESPFVDFSIGAASPAYIAPIGGSLAFLANGIVYAPPTANIIEFKPVERGVYSAPTSPNVLFALSCEDSTADLVYVLSSAVLGQIDVSGGPVGWGYVSGDAAINQIASEGTLDIPTAIAGTPTLDNITSDGVANRGNSAYSFGRLGQITSEGGIEISPYMYGEGTLGQIISDGNAIVAVIGSFVNMEFQNGIIHQKGRVLFGEDVPPVFRQVYEMSGNRSVEIRQYPEDANYPIFIADTQHNLSDEDLRIGTVAYQLYFDHDAREINYINVWVTEPSGHSFKVSVLDRPFKDHFELRIPIHCVSKKENQFHLEIVYENTITTIGTERYLIPFQPHCDNRNPYLNVSDQLNSVTGVGGTTNLVSEYVEVGRIFQTLDELPTHMPGANVSPFFTFKAESIEFSRLFLVLDELPNATGVSGTDSVKFTYITDNLGSIQIGG